MINILFTCDNCDFDGAADVYVEGNIHSGNLTYTGECPKCDTYFSIRDYG